MKLVLITLSIFYSISAFSSEQVVKLTGIIELSVKNGTIDANFQLKNIPKINNYLIHLNTGFNIQYFRNTKTNVNYSYKKSYNTQFSEESFGYFIQDKVSKKKLLPNTIQFKYTGKFPVITDLKTASIHGDWKGNIAFNGKTIRTDGFQTAWYPILYDVEQDKRYDEVSYNIEVVCLDCKSIYVNGSKPIASTHGIFKKEKPTSLTLFAGDYDFNQHNNSYYLNSGLSKQQMSELGKLTHLFQQFYQERLSLHYGEDVVYIHTTPTSKNDSWLFVSYPSIVTINHNKNGLSNLFNENESPWFKPFIAHELAHYYFGTYKKFNTELGDMFTESFAEYLALNLTLNLIDKKQYRKNITRKLQQLKSKKLTPIKYIENSSDYGDRELYVYTYAPIIWLAIEKEIGENKMWQWLNQMLTVKTKQTDYKFMIETLEKVLKDNNKLNFLVKQYFANEKAIMNAEIILNKTVDDT